MRLQCSAISQQAFGTQERHAELRRLACDYEEEHAGDFEAFLSAGKTGALESHLKSMRINSVWGTHLELAALSQVLGVNIVVYSVHEPKPVKIGGFPRSTKTLQLEYNGTHYNSVKYVGHLLRCAMS